MSRLAIIDGHQLVWRVVGAAPMEAPRHHAGRFMSWASVLPRYHSTTRTFVAWDVGQSFRKRMFKEYKAARKKEDPERQVRREAVRQAMRLIVPLLDAFGIPQLYRKGFEADDVIHTFTVRAIENPDVEVIVYSMDADLLQLVRFDRVLVLHATGDPLGRQYVVDKFGIGPEFLQTFKALSGDPSDGYKGVKGVGPKKAAALIQEHGDLFDIYKALDEGKIKGSTVYKLKAGREHARLCWKLAALRLVDYTERRRPSDRATAMSMILNAKIREALDPDVFEALIEEGT